MTCYTFNTFVGITNATWGIPCGAGPGIQSCCNSGDFCLSNDTCYTPTTKYGQGVMQLNNPYPYNWYVAGCTDPMYSAPQCSRLCYDYLGLIKPCTGNSWSCGCSLGSTCTCDNSGGPNFTMTPPSQLSTLASISGSTAIPWTSSSTSTSLSTSSITTSTTSSSSITSESSRTSTLTSFPSLTVPPPSNKATKIGVGVGVPLGIIIVIISGFAFILCRRIHSKPTTGQRVGRADPDIAINMKPELPTTTGMPLSSSSVAKGSENTGRGVSINPVELAAYEGWELGTHDGTDQGGQFPAYQAISRGPLTDMPAV